MHKLHVALYNVYLKLMDISTPNTVLSEVYYTKPRKMALADYFFDQAGFGRDTIQYEICSRDDH